MQEAISVENLNYTYPGVDDTPGVAVFVDMNLQVEKGSFVAVLGSNGCGKSTLANILMQFCFLAAGRSMFLVWIRRMKKKSYRSAEG